MDLFENRRKGEPELVPIWRQKGERAEKTVFTGEIGGSISNFAGSVKNFPHPTWILGCTEQNLAFRPRKWSCRSENMVNADEIFPVGPDIAGSYLE